MKKILLPLVILCLFPLGVSADIGVFIGSTQREHHPDIWTSASYPVASAGELRFEHRYAREDVPLSYFPTDTQTQERILGLFSDLDVDERVLRLEVVKSFSRDNFIHYLAMVLADTLDNQIAYKIWAGHMLSPYEEVFRTCGISVSDRRVVARNVIEHIYTERSNPSFTLESLEYNHPDLGNFEIFGDCVIPFPDRRRSPDDILGLTNTFESNRYIARTKQGNFLRFSENREQDMSIFHLSGSSFDNIENLNIDSQRLESSLSADKSHGRNRIIYVHKNHSINPFRNAIIQGTNIGGSDYRGTSITSAIFQNTHPLYIRASDNEARRTLQGWTLIRPGVYRKIVLQEDSFDASGHPRQQVGATSYYAILYNHDITVPVCMSNDEGNRTFFAHDSLGQETFQLQTGSWFNEVKYAFFACRDLESGCRCDSSDTDCFIRDGRVLSLPQALSHNSTLSYTFYNRASLSMTCTSTEDERLSYDFRAPDIVLRDSGGDLSGLTREFVSNDGVLYNGVQVTSRRFFAVREAQEYAAADEIDLSFHIFDPTSGVGQGRSGLSDIEIQVARQNGAIWQIFSETYYQTLSGETELTIALSDIDNALSTSDIQTQAGRYQVTIHAHDRAGNSLRAIVYYTIFPGPIDPTLSALEVVHRNTVLANNDASYEYTLTLRDSYSNPIVGRELQNIAHTCTGAGVDCKVVRTNMLGIPTGNGVLRFEMFDGGISNHEGNIFFQLRSLAPGVFTERFQVTFQNPSETHIFTSGQENLFLKPVIGVLETYDNGQWYNDRLYVGEERDYRVRATQSGVTVTPSFSLAGTIEGRHDDTWFTLSGSVTNEYTGLRFSGTFESSLTEGEEHKTLLEIREGDVSGVGVSYTLGGEMIQYRLSSTNRDDDSLTLTDTRPLDRPVRLIGGLQAGGNTHNPNERQNISDINSYVQRTDFRRTVTQHILSKQSGNIVGRVKYIDMSTSLNKNYLLEPNPGFDTLIVRNGNILIRDNFNIVGEAIGLISYIDNGYNIESGYNAVGNIYITPNVSRINAFIYADGALLSTQSNGVLITHESSVRTSTLPQQLWLKGLLFTRNTLAGSRLLDGNYMLPGNRPSTNQELAVYYDLYQTRRGNDGCDTDGDGFCNIPEYFVIEYDNRIISSPPPLFSR